MTQPRKTGKPRELEGDPEVDESGAMNPLDAETLDDFLRENLRTSEVEVKAPEIGGLPSLAFLQAHFKTKSAAIRYMNTQGHKPAVIAKHLGFRYQMVRNVLTNELKRGPNEDFTIPVSSGDQKVENSVGIQAIPDGEVRHPPEGSGDRTETTGEVESKPSGIAVSEEGNW